MSQIQRLLDVLGNAPGGTLHVVADAAITLERDGGQVALTKGPLPAEAWRNLVAQLVPPFAMAEFETAGALDTWLPFAGRTFEVHLTRDGVTPRATLREARPALRVEDALVAPAATTVVIDPGDPGVSRRAHRHAAAPRQADGAGCVGPAPAHRGSADGALQW